MRQWSLARYYKTFGKMSLSERLRFYKEDTLILLQYKLPKYGKRLTCKLFNHKKPYVRKMASVVCSRCGKIVSVPGYSKTIISYTLGTDANPQADQNSRKGVEGRA